LHFYTLSNHLLTSRDPFCTQEYGSGRQRLGIDQTSSSPPPANTSDSNPTLGEYLQFGKLIGERVQDVQRQLDINGAEVRVDEASEKILNEWQSEQMQAYSMFEALVDEGLRGSASQDNSTLVRNKNRLASGPASLAKFVEKAYGNAPKPMSAGDRKLARNRQRAGGGDKEIAADEEGTFELVALSSIDENDKTATPSLVGKPMRAAAEDSQVRCLKYFYIVGVIFFILFVLHPFYTTVVVWFCFLWFNFYTSRGVSVLFILFFRYKTASRVSDDTSLCCPSNNSASFLRPSAPNSVISFSSESVTSLIFTSLTSVSGIPSIFSGTSAAATENFF
jgi:hypothetical protein